MGKVIVYIAQSLDGFIATEDNGIDWLSSVEQANEDYGYGEFIKTVDAVVMGRKTYDKVLSFGIEFPHKDKKCYVLSNTLTGRDKNVTFYNGSLTELVTSLKKQYGGNLFIDGGGEVVGEFRAHNLIDGYILSIIPVLLGKGIRLFNDVDTKNTLKLIESKAFPSGLVQLKYECLK